MSIELKKEALWDVCLSLALRGKLVPQQEHCEEICAVKAPELLHPKSEDLPLGWSMDLPLGWRWVQLGDIGEWFKGITPRRDESSFWENGTFNWLKSGELPNGAVFGTNEHVTQLALDSKHDRTKLRLHPIGSVVISACVHRSQKLGVLAVPSAVNHTCLVCEVKQHSIDSWFLFYLLWGLKDELICKGKGSIIKNISKADLIATWIPLPPLEEQRQIVTKLSALKAKLDMWSNSQYILNEKLIPQLKRIFLQQAIHGQLVEHRREESPVTIQESLTSYGSDSDLVPFALPSSWRWVRAEVLGHWRKGQSPERSIARYWQNGTIPFLRSGELRDQEVVRTCDLITPEAISSSHHGGGRLTLIDVGSVVVALYGTANMGRLGVLGIPCVINEACVSVTVDPEKVLNWYLFYVIMANREELQLKAKGSHLMHITKSDLISMWVPLPPLAEQQRIVDKLQLIFERFDLMLGKNELDELLLAVESDKPDLSCCREHA